MGVVDISRSETSCSTAERLEIRVRCIKNRSYHHPQKEDPAVQNDMNSPAWVVACDMLSVFVRVASRVSLNDRPRPTCRFLASWTLKKFD